MDATDTSRIRKRPMSEQSSTSTERAGEIDIASHTWLSIRDPDHPLGHLIDGQQLTQRGPPITRRGGSPEDLQGQWCPPRPIARNCQQKAFLGRSSSKGVADRVQTRRSSRRRDRPCSASPSQTGSEQQSRHATGASAQSSEDRTPALQRETRPSAFATACMMNRRPPAHRQETDARELSAYVLPLVHQRLGEQCDRE
jgi:hypothetical protein